MSLPFAWDRIDLGEHPYPSDGVRMASSVEAVLIHEVERLQASVRELEEALRDVAASAHTDADRCPICGEELHAHASGCSIAYALAAVSAETPEGHTRMNDGITPSEPTEWLEDLNAVSAETEDDDE